MSPENLTEDTVVPVPLDEIVVADTPRTGGLDPRHVHLLASIDDKLPPIVVHRGTMRVIDGIHRLAAARANGAETIEVRFFDGDADAAFVLAVSSNISHGLPLSVRERTAAAVRILHSHPEWSDRAIASTAGISARTVAELREDVGADAGPIRLGADGRLRPVDGTHGRRAAAEILATRPELSLRQVAKLAGISPETVRDVKNRLNNGEAPVPAQRRGSSMPAPEEPENRSPDSRPAHTGSLVRRLQTDRGFRESAESTALLWMFQVHLGEPRMWERLVSSVPPHCGDTVARLAMECSRIWDALADEIEGTAETA